MRLLLMLEKHKCCCFVFVFFFSLCNWPLPNVGPATDRLHRGRMLSIYDDRNGRWRYRDFRLIYGSEQLQETRAGAIIHDQWYPVSWVHPFVFNITKKGHLETCLDELAPVGTYRGITNVDGIKCFHLSWCTQIQTYSSRCLTCLHQSFVNYTPPLPADWPINNGTHIFHNCYKSSSTKTICRCRQNQSHVDNTKHLGL